MSEEEVLITNEELKEIVSAANEAPEDILIDSYRAEMFDEDKNSFLNAICETTSDQVLNDLKSLLKSKIEFGFPEYKFDRLKNVFSEFSDCYLMNFSLSDASEGYVIMHHKLATYALQILFGAQPDHLESKYPLKKSRIASSIIEQLTHVFLGAFLKAIPDAKSIPYSLLKVEDEFKTKNTKVLNDYYYRFRFGCVLNEETMNVVLILPDKFMETYLPAKKVAADQGDRKAIRQQVLDLDVDLVAAMDEVKLDFVRVMNMEVGDLIPIRNPNRVKIMIDQKKVFEGTPVQRDNGVCVCVE